MTATPVVAKLSARGRLHGMRVIIPNSDTPETEWTVLDRHPDKGCWWLHRRDDAGNWVTTWARYSELVQIL